MILGASGQVGRPLALAFTKAGWRVVCPSHAAVDFMRPKSLHDLLSATGPELVLNAAAMTDVEGCTHDPMTAWRVNAFGPIRLAELAAAAHIRLVHISTDAVFDGESGRPYREDDLTHPLQTYGRTKRAAEEGILDLLPDALILRTAWVFGGGTARDLAVRMLGWSVSSAERGAKRSTRASTDQISSPTHAGDLAERTLDLVRRDAEGIFHVVNAGMASRYTFARFLYDLVGNPVRVTPVLAEAFPTQAVRPKRTDLATCRLEALGLGLRPWQDALANDRETYVAIFRTLLASFVPPNTGGT